MNMEQNSQENNPMSFEEYAQYVAELKERLAKIDINPIDVWSLINKKADELRQKYGKEMSKYATWHVLAGSTLMSGTTPEFKDFPGADSIELWLEKLEEQLKSEAE